MEPVTTHSNHDEPAAASPIWPWVVIETLTSPDETTVVLDGASPRAFSRLNRTSVARASATAARMLGPLVAECASMSKPRDKYFPLRDDQLRRMMTIPVLGPSGHVHAVAVWVGGVEEPLPRTPIIGAIEWSVKGLAVANPAAQYLFRAPQGDLLTGHTIPEMLAAFDIWPDRPGFLSLFNLENLDVAADQWSGTATLHYDNPTDTHELFIAARAVGTGPNRVVRAVVTDITGTQNPGHADLTLVAVRAMPITPGHAVALADLKTGFIHEWLTSSPSSPLAAWRHHNPEFDDNSKLDVVQTCFALATGVRDTATHEVRVRFDPADDWIPLLAKWTLIGGGDRPQALIDVTPLAPISAPMVTGCRMCQDMANRNNAPHQ
ncbi:GAF domain-containing protein [Nocardia sp. NPDC052001]|uniref:GAF domain-containing protein n=1 Tax=Nocardia sp. NPDC052001 TaxID=3154853 RepID=UPI00342DCDF8